MGDFFRIVYGGICVIERGLWYEEKDMSEGREDYGMGECSIDYPRDLCECIMVTVRVYRIVDIRYCALSCMDGNILTK